MARLINDTGILGDTTVTVSTMTTKGNFEELVSLETIIDAVHTKQEELKITGRTAEEAFGTVEGSLSALKAAFSNWKVGLGDENADMSGLTDTLFGTFQTAADNVIPVVEQIGESLTQVFSDITGIDLTPVTAVFDGLKTSLTDIGAAFAEGGITGALAEIVSQIEQLTGLDLSGVTETFGNLSETFADIGAAFAEGGISGVFEMLTSNLERMTGIDLSGLVSGIGEFFEEIITVDDSTVESVGGAIQSVINAFSSPGVDRVVSGVASGIGEFLSAFDDVAETVISFVAEIIGQLARDFNDMAPGVAGAAAGIGIFAGGLALMQAFQGIPALLSGISTAFSVLNTVMAANPILLVVSILGGLIAALVTAYNTSEDFRNSVDQLWETLKKGVSDAVEGLKKSVDEIGKAISDTVTKIKEKGTEMFNAGRDLIQGLVDGITEKVNAVKETVSGAFNKVVDWANGVFDRHSPSKVFAEMGRDLMRGLAVGIDDESGIVQDSIDKLRLTVPPITAGRVDFKDSAIGKASAATVNGMFASAGGSSVGTQTINLVVDGRTLAQVMFDPLNGIIKQKGVAFGA